MTTKEVSRIKSGTSNAVVLFDDTLLKAAKKQNVCGIIPKYDVDDIVYVKEPWANISEIAYTNGVEVFLKKSSVFKNGGIEWKAAGEMKKEMANIYLKITSVEICPIQNLRKREAKKMGFKKESSNSTVNSIIYEWNEKVKEAKKGLNNIGYDKNPYVYYIQFEVFKILE